MDALINSFEQRLAQTSTEFVRSMMEDINWGARLIGLKGARGVGKTTLLLQYIKIHLAEDLDRVLYLSLDHVWFNSHSLFELIETFEQRGGKYLFLDEVHKYENWAQELKSAYDDFPDLKIVFTGSSLLEILNARADLSRRAIVYQMQGLSFREYIAIESGHNFNKITLTQLLKHHRELARELTQEIKPFQFFESYLKTGYYPFYKEERSLYFIRLAEVINLMLEIELPLLRKVEVAYVARIKQLLAIIAASVPFQPNVTKLSQKIGINRNTLLTYFHYLEEIGLTLNLFKESEGISSLQKPRKTYLENTNMMHLLAPDEVNQGNSRETFFANQLAYKHALTFAQKGDFVVDGLYTFEIGGKNKTSKQLQRVENAYVVLDDLLIGSERRIPLWLFGFLY